MRKLLTIMIMLCLSINLFAQTPSRSKFYIQDEYFYAQGQNGNRGLIDAKFRLLSTPEELITTDAFKTWEYSTFVRDSIVNRGYIEKNKSKSHIETFLMGEVLSGYFYAELSCKNRVSFTPLNLNEGEGDIWYNKETNEIKIAIPFKAQNGYGNYIMSTGYLTIFIDSKGNLSSTYL